MDISNKTEDDSNVVVIYKDIEELKSFNYGIDIVNEPVKQSLDKSPDLLENTLYMKSKFGQQYQCSFPNKVEQEKKKEEEEKTAMEIGIPDLLKPLEDGPCLFKAKDWWSYEFCYGKYVRQFHVEDGKISGDIIYLGHYESEFDWNNETNQGSRNNNRLNRYHSQRYVNGSKCDITGKGRQTEVRFLCDEGSGDYISRIDEPGTCSYIMYIHTTKICHHPYLKPPTKNKPIQITCSPLLTDLQYDEYLQHIEEEKKLKELKELEEQQRQEMEKLKELEEFEKRKKEKERILRDKDQETDDDVDVSVEGEDDSLITKENKLLSEEDLLAGEKLEADLMKKFGSEINTDLQKELQKLMGQASAQKTGAEPKMKVKVVTSMDDLKDVLKEAMMEAKNLKTQKPSDKILESSSDTGEIKDDENEVKEMSEGKKGEKSDIEETTEVKGESSDLKFRKTKVDDDDTDKSFGVDWKKFSMKRMTEAIIDLEEKSKILLELFTKYTEPDPDLIFDIKKLRQKYVETVAEVKEIKSELLDKLLTMNVEKIEDLKEFKVTADMYEEKYDAVIEKLESVTAETGEMIELLQGLLKQEDKAAGKTEEEEDTDDDIQGPKKTSLKDKVKVTLTKLGNKDIADIKNSKNSLQMDQLEKEVQESLEEAGLDLGEGKIQVKIITAGYFDDKEEKLHILSDEDTKSFKNMIVSILGGDNEAAKEQQKQSQLEDNYNFVWGKDNKKSKGL